MFINPKNGGKGRQAGFSLLEVLITIVILAFGLLGLAGLQSKIQLAEMESYQRAEALVLLQDMVERMQNYDPTAIYYDKTTATLLGTGTQTYDDCATLAGIARDQCEWDVSLRGAAEAVAGIGATNAHGCIKRLQDPVVNSCDTGSNTPGIYLVTVTWTGINPTTAPSNICPGDTASIYLRSVSARVSLGVPSC